ncbi:MAG TPA: response regulator [Steroidobacteraceae bacterium]|jgi:CheY-like chemotaxis protein
MHKILIIDDEPDVRDSIKCVLDLAGYTVAIAEGASPALDQLARVPTDLVITDIIMPKIDGVQTIRLIRKSFPSVRIIAISGGGNFGAAAYQPAAIKTNAYLASALEAGAHSVLLKPFEPEDLLEAIEQVLGIGHA